MIKHKKVTGERIAAAVIDSIIVEIVGFIFLGIWFAFTLDFSNIIDSLISSVDVTDDSYKVYMIYLVSTQMVFGVLYFSFVPYKMKGQTLAKKFLNIKAVNEYGENPSFVQHLIRAIQNWGGYLLLISIPLVFVDMLVYSIAVTVLGLLAQLILIISLIMLASREDGKGMHDLMAGTTVVSCHEDFNKEFAMKTAQMGGWAEVVDDQDEGFKDSSESNEDKDEWDF